MNIYVITGAIQTGKTTWIARMLEQAAQRGQQVSGVLAPAVFEDGVKTGIDALLLPSGECFELARKNPAFEQLHKDAAGASSADPEAAAARRVRLNAAGSKPCFCTCATASFSRASTRSGLRLSPPARMVATPAE